MTTESRPLALILAVYFVLAALYAWYTPLWQAPDEPAHYNNVRHVVETGSLPFLHPGDYDQDYLEAIKARRFPPEMSIDSIRYEGHQPPLYYWLAAPLLLITQGMGYEIQVLALRLFSVFLGAGVVGFIWASARHLFPDKLLLATLAAGFAAFLPMHLAMMTAINNDALAELIIALGVYRLLVHLKYPRAGFSAWLVTGIVVGLATYGYKVIETVGRRITKMRPSRGFCAEFAAATTVLTCSKLGLPISTTHTLVGSVMGVGLARGLAALNLSVIRGIVASWFVTLPVTAGIALAAYEVLRLVVPLLVGGPLLGAA